MSFIDLFFFCNRRTRDVHILDDQDDDHSTHSCTEQEDYIMPSFATLKEKEAEVRIVRVRGQSVSGREIVWIVIQMKPATKEPLVKVAISHQLGIILETLL